MSHSRTTRNLVAAAVCLLPLLAACGTGSSDSKSPSAAGTGQLTTPADASDAVKKRYSMENAVARCMKKAGFSYTPEAPDDPAKSWAHEGADYDLTKKYRQKYGFGTYAASVYPDDPQAPGNGGRGTSSANTQYVDTLTPSQKTAYDKALGGSPEVKLNGGSSDAGWTGCMGSAHRDVYGDASPQDESATQRRQDQQNAQALNGDAKLIALAQSYASCLRKDGIQVTTTQPTGIGSMVGLQAHQSAPAGARGGGASKSGSVAMSKDEAMPLLQKDIDLSLQDLECGKDFRAAYFPKFLKAPTSGGGAG
ncbi:hypothetical protein [Streptomyces griseoluteus]|uniref:hypothetical protein n=1 Tax=Streptomyces griseoluteus TaxID=29306 RepID=UPI00381E54F3